MFVSRRYALAGLAALAFSAPLAVAQEFQRPVRIIVPWGASTPPDLAVRLVSGPVSEAIGQPVVVENRPGAGGTVGLMEFMRLAPDGHAFMTLGQAQLLTPVMYPKVPVDLRKDITGVVMLESFDNVLVVGNDSPHRTVAELVASLRAKPGMTFGSGGNGTPAHMSGEVFKQQTGLQATHVPYNVFPQAIGDVIAGRLDFMFLAAPAAVPQVRGGKLRALAVTGAGRVAGIDTVVPMREQGFPDFVVSSMDTLVTHAAAPKANIARLNAAVNQALALPAVKEGLGKIASVPVGGTVESLNAWILSTIDRWGAVAIKAGLKAD